MTSHPFARFITFRNVRVGGMICGLIILLAACSPVAFETVQLSATQTGSQAVQASITSPFNVFFTDPYHDGSNQKEKRIDQEIINALDQAQKNIDLAMYNFSSQPVADALLRAQKRGVKVRLVMESDSLDGKIPQELMDFHIPVQSDRHEALMHNKFIVIDGMEVWTGSLNLTPSGIHNDNNNMVQVMDKRIAQAYETEFNEMFVNGQFGAESPRNTTTPPIKVDGKTVEVYFSPEDAPLQHLLDLVRSANHRIDIMAYTLTSPALMEALLERARQGVEIHVVFETDQVKSGQGSQYTNLRKAGLDVRKDTLKGLMHEKVMIVDNEAVAFGSYNFTRNAEENNDENLMIIHDPEVASQFTEEFEKIYNKSKP